MIKIYSNHIVSFRALLVGAFLLEAAGYIAFPFVALQLRDQFKLSQIQCGTILMIAVALRPVWAIAGGLLSERVRSIHIFVAACLAESTSFFLLYGADSSIGAWVALILGNIGFALWTPNLFALIYRWFPDNDPKRKISLLNGALNAGAAAGCLAGGLLVSMTIPVVFFSAGLLYLLVTPILGMLMINDRNLVKDQQLQATIQPIFQPKNMLALAIGGFGFWASYAQFMSYFSWFAADWLGQSAIVGAGFGLLTLMVALFSLALSTIAHDRYRLKKLSVIGTIALAIGWIAMTKFVGLVTTIIFVTALAFAEACISLQLVDIWASMNPSRTGLMQGFNFATRNIAMGAGSFMGSLIYSPHSPHLLQLWGLENAAIIGVAMLGILYVLLQRPMLVPMTRHLSTMMVMLSICFSCGAKTQTPSKLKFDAAHSIALDAVIPDGRLLTASNDEKTVELEVRKQLAYSIGHLNGIDGVTDWQRGSVEVISRKPLNDGSNLFEVRYSAKFLVAWSRDQVQTNAFDLLLPVRADSIGLTDFFNRFGRQCIDRNAPNDVEADIFWYYYRPQNCNMLLGENAQSVSVVTINQQVSGENTDGKFPEYQKIWEDNELKVMAVFGKYAPGSSSHSDAGIRAFTEFYRMLTRRFGKPVEDLGSIDPPSAENPYLNLKFLIPSGPLNIALLLVDELSTASPEFIEKFTKHSKNADFISYSGHSGLGANIHALARMGQVAAGQYQLFMLNGCDTYAYVDKDLRDIHANANPEFGPDKFFDLITNAMPSYFSTNAQTNMTVIDALVGKSKTYREILREFDPSQRSIVTGEQDNSWPNPF